MSKVERVRLNKHEEFLFDKAFEDLGFNSRSQMIRQSVFVLYALKPIFSFVNNMGLDVLNKEGLKGKFRYQERGFFK